VPVLDRPVTLQVPPASRSAVLFVDDDVDLRETIVDVTTYLGIGRCISVGSLAELEARRTDALACSLAILDINLGENAPSGIDVYHWLKTVEFAGTVVFLTGHGADDPRVQQAARLAEVPILTKPIGIAELKALVSNVGRAR
jgi:DNA-binding response OmpR family regulator